MNNYSARMPSAGDLVTVNVLNSLENRSARGKTRPAVLVAREGGHWVTMGLTTNPSYRSGDDRVAVPNPFDVGLRSPGYLWGSRLTNVSAIDVDRLIGRADDALVEAVIELAQLNGRWAAQLRTGIDFPEAA